MDKNTVKSLKSFIRKLMISTVVVYIYILGYCVGYLGITNQWDMIVGLNLYIIPISIFVGTIVSMVL
jgi:hypothetical protein